MVTWPGIVAVGGGNGQTSPLQNFMNFLPHVGPSAVIAQGLTDFNRNIKVI